MIYDQKEVASLETVCSPITDPLEMFQGRDGGWKERAFPRDIKAYKRRWCGLWAWNEQAKSWPSWTPHNHSRFLCSCHRRLRHPTSLSLYLFLTISPSPSRLSGRKKLSPLECGTVTAAAQTHGLISGVKFSGVRADSSCEPVSPSTARSEWRCTGQWSRAVRARRGVLAVDA